MKKKCNFCIDGTEDLTKCRLHWGLGRGMTLSLLICKPCRIFFLKRTGKGFYKR